MKKYAHDGCITLTRQEWADLLNASRDQCLAELPAEFHPREALAWLEYRPRCSMIHLLEHLIKKIIEKEKRAGRKATRTFARGAVCLMLDWSESTLARHMRQVTFGEPPEPDAPRAGRKR